MATFQLKNLAVTPDDHHLVERIKVKTGAKSLQEVTHKLLLAGAEVIAPEELLPAHNAKSNITPEQFEEVVRDEEDVFARHR